MKIRGASIILLLGCSLLWSQRPEILEQNTFPASGDTGTKVHIPKPGRYRFQATSEQGVALSLTDHMLGPFVGNGEAGVQDGRIDALLDKSTYKLRLHAHQQGQGQVTVKVLPFEELQPTPVNLPKHQLITETLGDLQQRTWLLVLPQAETVQIEIMGRHLADAQIWYPGDWVSGIQAFRSVHEPTPGKPMTHLEFNHQLPAGTYLLTCYAGPAQQWAEEDHTQPLYLRRGIRSFGAFGTHALTLSPFGRDTFLVHGDANWHEIARTDKTETWLTVAASAVGVSRFSGGASALINKESRTAYASVNQGNSQPQWVTISGKPGDQVRYRHFQTRQRVEFRGERSHWLGSMHTLAGRDMLDVNAILRPLATNQFYKPVASQLVSLRKGSPIGRRTNLMRRMELFLEVEEEGAFIIEEVTEDTARARFRIEPFMVNRPRDYRTPPYKGPGQAWRLTKGYHKLTVDAVAKGIHTFTIRHEDDRRADAVILQPEEVPQDVNWPNLRLENTNYVYHINNRDDTAAGVFVRELPVDLNEGLPFELKPGQSITLPVVVKSPQFLYTEGKNLQVSNRGQTLPSGHALAAGTYTLDFRNNGDQPDAYYVSGDPDLTHLANTIPSDGVGQMPRLTEGAPAFADFARNDRKFFRLDVTEPGLYRVETSGRMAMGLAIRSRLTAAPAEARENGVGRNALVQQYLRPGTYLVTVGTFGKSQGRAGIHLKRNPLTEGGTLSHGEVRKITLPKDAAVRYRIDTDAAKWHVVSMGQGKLFRTRLDDAEGFPVAIPGERETWPMDMPAGTYYLYSLPEAVDSRRLTYLNRIEPKIHRVGKGPHPLSFNEQIDDTWMKGGPDIYAFQLESRVKASLSMTRGLRAVLKRDGAEVWETTQAESQLMVMEPGAYELHLTRTEEDDRFHYSLSLRTDWLSPGIPQTLNQQARAFTFSLARDSLVALHSMGNTDVRARLTGAGIDITADDGPDDWNFNLSRQLPPGDYQLDVSVVGDRHGPVTLTMMRRTETSLPAASIPLKVALDAGRSVTRIPITIKQEALLALRAEGGSLFNLALVQENSTLVQASETLTAPVAPGNYEVLVWAEGGNGKGLLTGVSAQVTSKILKKSLSLKAGWYLLQQDGSTAWQLSNDEGARFSPQPGTAPHPVTSGLVNMHGGRGWLYLARSSRLSPYRLTDEPTVISLAQQQVSFPITVAGGGPTLVEVEAVGLTPAVAMSHLSWDATLIHGNRAWTLIPNPGEMEALVWKTDEAHGAHRISIATQTFQMDSPRTIGAGMAQHTLAPGHAMSFTGLGALPELVLDPGVFAALHDGHQIKAMVGRPDQTVHTIMHTKANQVTFVNTSTQDKLFRLHRGSIPTTKIIDWQDDVMEHLAAEAGDLRLNFAERKGRIYLPQDAEAWWFAPDGYRRSVHSGDWIDTGFVRVRHQGGIIQAATGDDTASTLMGSTPKRAGTLSPPNVLIMQKKAVATKTPLNDPGWLQVDSDVPICMAVYDDNDQVAYEAGRSLGVFLPAGDYVLHTRPLRGSEGTATIHVRRPIPERLEGPGPFPERLLVAGELAIHRFSVLGDAMVGAGVQAHDDRIDARLFDTRSKLVSHGPLVLQELTAGDYILVVQSHGPPVRYRPVLYGHMGPGNKIPDDVLRQYAKEAGQ